MSYIANTPTFDISRHLHSTSFDTYTIYTILFCKKSLRHLEKILVCSTPSKTLPVEMLVSHPRLAIAWPEVSRRPRTSGAAWLSSRAAKIQLLGVTSASLLVTRSITTSDSCLCLRKNTHLLEYARRSKAAEDQMPSSASVMQSDELGITNSPAHRHSFFLNLEVDVRLQTHLPVLSRLYAVKQRRSPQTLHPPTKRKARPAPTSQSARTTMALEYLASRVSKRRSCVNLIQPGWCHCTAT